jgi:hypothetical protein
VRAGPGAGAPIENLSVSELTLFTAGKLDFEEVETRPRTGPTDESRQLQRLPFQPATGAPAGGESASRIREQQCATNVIRRSSRRTPRARSALYPESRRHPGWRRAFALYHCRYPDAPGCVLRQTILKGSSRAAT